MFASSLFVTLITLSTVQAAPLMPGAARPAVVPGSSIVEKVAEGFSSNREAAPEAVKRAWNSTYILISEKTLSKGTAFVVASTNMGELTRLFFLTNWHVVNEQCSSAGSCSDSILARNIRIINSGSKIQSIDVKLRRVQVVKSNPRLDLALLSVDVDSDSALPQPLKLSSECSLIRGQHLFSVGFSNTTRRLNARVPIVEQNVIQKRWSHGVFVSYMKSKDLGSDVDVVGTTVDLIPGHSGAALLDSSGQVVGALRSSMSSAKNNFQYDGNEDPNHLDWHSKAVRCEYLADFINGGVEVALQK